MTEFLVNAWQGWQRFWFDKTDPLPVCVMRWPMVGMILYTHLIWTFDFEAFFSDQASWQSREFVQQYQSEQFAYSFWWLVSAQWMWAVHCVCLLVISLFWVGFATPITGWMTLLIVVSYANRVPLAMYGLDQVNGIAAFYLAIAPSGSRLSVDAWIRRKRFQLAASGRRAGSMIATIAFWGACPEHYCRSSSSTRLALRLFQVHLCFIYLWGGLGKLQGETWWNGEAIWYAVSSLDYQSNDLTWIVYFPWLYQALSVGTWAWEISFPILVWQDRLRPWVLMVGLTMHLGIGMFMGMWTFGLAMLFLYLSFIPAEAYRVLWTRAHRWLKDLLGETETGGTHLSVSACDGVTGGSKVLTKSDGG
jgi:hypothetical protein